ncbi:hypothetical protein, partial [Pseudomonas aeruginosa]|uniref:hypothetical protein n=1 Tax=Pseudomonas aeruginosa TaxID=287 RepID=UPI0031B70E2D
MGSLVCLALFNLFSLHSLWGWLFLLAAPLLVKQARYVMREMDPVAMRPMLERTVKGALLTNLLFVLGIFLSQWAASDKYQLTIDDFANSPHSAIY